MFYIPPYVTGVLGALEKNNFEAYAVGGCVRDMLLGRTPGDFDVATDASPPRVVRIFSEEGFRVAETGLKHGTVTVISPGNPPVEITTYRIDSEYTDNRHPESVAFTKSLYEDAARRDFTMNAMAYNPQTGLKDYYGGEADIRNKKIRCVGDPDKRFSEDALRIMRALRFSSVLGFEIEEETEKAVFRNKNLLTSISAERTASELGKLICGQYAARAIVKYAEVISVIIPELGDFGRNNPGSCAPGSLEQTAAAVEKIPPEPHLRFAALLHDIGIPDSGRPDCGHGAPSAEIAGAVMRRLKLDNSSKEKAAALIRYHDAPAEEDRKAVKKMLSKLGAEMYFDLINLRRAAVPDQDPDFFRRQAALEKAEKAAADILQKGECFSLKNLNINGNDLIKLGFKGKEIGSALSLLLEAVINETIPNEKKSLEEYVRG